MSFYESAKLISLPAFRRTRSQKHFIFVSTLVLNEIFVYSDVPGDISRNLKYISLNKLLLAAGVVLHQ